VPNLSGGGTLLFLISQGRVVQLTEQKAKTGHNTKKRIIRILTELAEESPSKAIKLRAAEHVMRLAGWSDAPLKGKSKKQKAADKLLGM